MHFFLLRRSKSVGGFGNVATNSNENRKENNLDQTNSILYSAMYFRNKLYLDQNENIMCFSGLQPCTNRTACEKIACTYDNVNNN